MKKYFAILTAFFAVILSSCSNEDITIKTTTTFKINPSSVINGFREWRPGDLTVINGNYHLRVRLLIYNESGQLINEDEQYFDDYAHIMTSNLELETNKTYKAIAITDITRTTDSFEYWTLSDKQDLGLLRISDTGYIGSQRNILGISNYEFTCGESDQINIDVQPAGSLMIVYYQGIRAWGDVSEYQLGINRSADYITFDKKNAQPEWNVSASSSFDWRISLIQLEDWDDQPNINNIYDYVFTLPYGNTNMKFQAKTSEGWLDLTRTISLNLGRGSEYVVTCDIENQEIKSEQWAFSRAENRQTDHIPYLPTESIQNSLLVKDYLKTK